MANLLRTADMRSQKKKKKQGETMRKSTLILGCACIAMTAAAVLTWQAEDQSGPEIFFEGESPVYRQGMDTEELLNGVYAEDERDGNVSSSLRIESVYLTGNGENAIVVYAAKDSQNHVTKKRRTISCMAEETDIDNSAVTAMERPEESENKSVQGDTGQDQRELLEEMEPQRPRLYLSVYEVSLQSGAVFDSLQYVERIEDDTDSEEELRTRIQINGTVDSGTVGTYAVEYLVTDSEGNQSNTAVLTVHVAEMA